MHFYPSHPSDLQVLFLLVLAMKNYYRNVERSGYRSDFRNLLGLGIASAVNHVCAGELFCRARVCVSLIVVSFLVADGTESVLRQDFFFTCSGTLLLSYFAI
jgi:hypothetical protein